jgi:hypothetical protein
MIGDAIFLEIIRADFFRTVAAADLRFALGGLRVVNFLFFDFLQARAQNAHRFFAVFDLRFFVLHRNDDAGRQMRQTNGGISRVDRLTAGTDEQNVSIRKSF